MSQTIMMIHGMFCTGRDWDHYRGFFEERGYRCVTPHLRYHDVDPQAPPVAELGRVSLLDYASDLEGEIRKIEGKPIIMGHSMGGLIAQILASRGLASALVLLTPASPRGILALKPSVLKTFLGIMIQWGFWRKPIRLSFDATIYSILNGLPPQEQKAQYAKMVFESGRAAFEMGFWLFDSRKASQVDASRVTCPVSLVAGGRDRITPAAVVRQVAKKYGPSAAYQEFPGHTHWVIGEPGWEEVAEWVSAWIAERRISQGA